MISVVITVYNVEKYIINCLKSFENQDYRDFEVLLVNDGTKDSSIVLAEEYLKNSSLNCRIINKENGGLSSARNTGLNEAKGEFVVFIDCDDAVSSDFLSALVKPLQEKNYDFSFCGFQFTKEQIPPNDRSDRVIEYKRESLLISFLRRDINFVVPSMMFRKSFLLENSLFFNEKIRFSEDQPFIWNVILHSSDSIYLYKKMYGYYVRENSIMTSTSKDRLLKSFEEFKDYIENLVSGYPEYSSLTDMIVPRWCLGSLYTASTLMDYDNFKDVYKRMDGRSILKKISGIKEMKSYLLAAVALLSPKLLYELSRRMH